MHAQALHGFKVKDLAPWIEKIKAGLIGTTTVQKFIVLGVYGSYFFWPGWTAEPDWQDLPITDGYDTSGTILDFTWPSGVGSASNLAFYAALWNPSDPKVTVSILEFGYESSCP